MEIREGITRHLNYLFAYFWDFVPSLAGNSIQKVNGLQSGCFANLVTLELRGNQLDTTHGINLPNLRQLYLVITELYDLVYSTDAPALLPM